MRNLHINRIFRNIANTILEGVAEPPFIIDMTHKFNMKEISRPQNKKCQWLETFYEIESGDYVFIITVGGWFVYADRGPKILTDRSDWGWAIEEVYWTADPEILDNEMEKFINRYVDEHENEIIQHIYDHSF